MKVLLASFEPRRDRDPDRLTLRSKANPHREQQAVIEPTDQDPRTLRADAQRPLQHPSGRYGAHETSSCSSASPRSLGAERVHCRLDVRGLRHVEITEDAVSIRAVLVDYEARCVAVAVHHVAVTVDGARPLLDDDTL